MIRFFLALDIPEESKEELQVVQEKVQKLFPEAKLTDNNKLHLTIAFIGNQPDDLKEKLIAVMTEAATGVGAFTVTPSFIDGFPHLHTAKILWAGVSGDIDKLYLLRHRIKDGLADINLPVDERRYVPHIALAKLKNLDLTPEAEKELEKIMSFEFEPINITSLKLYESIPGDGFHSHNTLAEIKLSP